MPLTPTFSVTPLQPLAVSYDSVAGVYNHYGYLQCSGVFFHAWHDRRLADQYTQDKAVLYLDQITSPASTAMPSPWYKYSGAVMGFKTKATTENQYLLIFHVVGMWGARAAFYINGNLVRSEEVAGEEYIAILLDCPPSQTWTYAYMFLEGRGRLDLKGIECYIL